MYKTLISGLLLRQLPIVALVYKRNVPNILENKRYCLTVYFGLVVVEWDCNNIVNYMCQCL
jgi:hypothetical protein